MPSWENKGAWNDKAMKFNILFIIWSGVFCLAVHNSCVSSDSDDFARELKSMEKGIALPYHSALDEEVKIVAGKHLPATFKLHEGFIDSVLLKRNMPIELKYLPYALSGMRADYEQGDRVGYWALPSLVGMRYGLAIDANRDERLAVEASTLAALDYIDDLHKKYNDWWYCILAYANSPTSLSHAMIHEGGEPVLWDFYERQLMPNTKVIADFIACIYLGNQNKLDFSAKAIEPSVVKAVESANVATSPSTDSGTQKVATGSSTEPAPKKATSQKAQKIEKYKIKKGDTLSKIAAKHHVTVDSLMKWNHLKDDHIREGKTLIIKK